MKNSRIPRTLRFTYTCHDEYGFLLEECREPAEITIGNEDLIPILERTLDNMQPGEERTLKVPCKKAFGPYREELVGFLPEALLEDLDPLEIGMLIEVQAPDGELVQGTITSLEEDGVLFDANHPLAGKDLTYHLRLVSRRD